MQVLLVSGSLRTGSMNEAVLRTVQAVAPDDIETVIYDGLGDLPHFNPDLDASPLPPPVDQLRGAVRTADAVLFSTPEYAGTLPGSFKNLLDWTIGDDQPGSIYEKPVAWINSSPRGATGADETLRAVLTYAHATIVDAACAHVPVTPTMVDEDGLIADESVRDHLRRALGALVGES